MEYKVIISESAVCDIDEILAYITDKLANPKAASDFANELGKRYTALARQPQMFEASHNERLKRKGYRRFPVKHYVVFYQVNEKNKEVIIARIFYGNRNCEKYL
jgi:addiction module RelE/StbE family toxin